MLSRALELQSPTFSIVIQGQLDDMNVETTDYLVAS